MTQEEKKFKLLKITDTKGNCNYVPFNNSNVQFYREHKQKLTREKQEKFSIQMACDFSLFSCQNTVLNNRVPELRVVQMGFS